MHQQWYRLSIKSRGKIKRGELEERVLQIKQGSDYSVVYRCGLWILVPGSMY